MKISITIDGQKETHEIKDFTKEVLSRLTQVDKMTPAQAIIHLIELGVKNTPRFLKHPD